MKYANISPAYRRALWTVVILNAGYGVIEVAAGYFGGSQALKADSLDFLGDGLITFIGLLAVRWGPRWRAKAALGQGVFLGLMGAGILANAAYRLTDGSLPEAEVMGIFGGIGLLVNLTAAALLVPHRSGDANARAIWLYSRNDALGNIAVVTAGGLVALTSNSWPDLAVAVIIAGLFLHSSWSIVQSARAELATNPAVND